MMVSLKTLTPQNMINLLLVFPNRLLVRNKKRWIIVLLKMFRFIKNQSYSIAKWYQLECLLTPIRLVSLYHQTWFPRQQESKQYRLHSLVYYIFRVQRISSTDRIYHLFSNQLFQLIFELILAFVCKGKWYLLSKVQKIFLSMNK